MPLQDVIGREFGAGMSIAGDSENNEVLVEVDVRYDLSRSYDNDTFKDFVSTLPDDD